MTIMLDLFGQTPIAGLRVAEAVLSSEAQEEAQRHASALAMTPYRHQGWEGKRLVRRFGWSPEGEEEAIPDWLVTIRAVAALAFDRDPGGFDMALVNRYDPGAGIGWHRDRPPYREVIGVSLGAPAEMAFRRRRQDGGFERAKLSLVPGSAYLLSGPARSEWQHGIATHHALRFSLTFRSR